MKQWLAVTSALAACAAHAAALAPDSFSWRAPINMPAGASLVRVELPATALARLQTAAASDVRVFNASGEVVPFAWLPSPESARAPEEKGASHRALPLFTLPASTRKPQGSVEVHVGGAQPVWMRIDGSAAGADARPLDSVLFDTRGEHKPLAAIDVEAQLPANTPVRIVASTSADLAQWTPVPVRGRIYRFDGEGAPVNMRLVFDPPVALEDRYLRLDWAGQEGITISAITAVPAAAALAPPRVRLALPALREAGTDAAELAAGFATPIAALALTTPRENTLVPVRVLGRNDVSQPWAPLGQTVVYRLGTGGDAMVNPPLQLQGASARQLRIVSTNGAALAPVQLHAEAEFTPRELVFVASGAAPFTLAAGREHADNAALPLPTLLVGTTGTGRSQNLPLATLGAAQESAPSSGGPEWLPALASKQTALWAVLLAGVAILGGVAWTLMRQMKDERTTEG
jgi:hypothetical protein